MTSTPHIKSSELGLLLQLALRATVPIHEAYTLRDLLGRVEQLSTHNNGMIGLLHEEKAGAAVASILATAE